MNFLFDYNHVGWFVISFLSLSVSSVFWILEGWCMQSSYAVG